MTAGSRAGLSSRTCLRSSVRALLRLVPGEPVRRFFDAKICIVARQVRSGFDRQAPRRSHLPTDSKKGETSGWSLSPELALESHYWGKQRWDKLRDRSPETGRRLLRPR